MLEGVGPENECEHVPPQILRQHPPVYRSPLEQLPEAGDQQSVDGLDRRVVEYGARQANFRWGPLRIR